MAHDPGKVVEEYATAFRSGDMQLWTSDPEVEAVYPAADRIKHKQKYREKVYQRKVIVVEDWTEVPA